MAANLNVPARLIGWLRAPAKLSNRRFKPVSRIRLFVDNTIYLACWGFGIALIFALLSAMVVGGVALLSAGL